MFEISRTEGRLVRLGKSKTPLPDLAEILAALGDPLRLKIVRMLAEEGERACGSFEIDMPKSSLSHHFKVLRESGIIESWKDGAQTINRLRRSELDKTYPGLLDSVLRAKHGS